MKQPDFFRLFAEKMQSATPPPDFSGGDWQALQGRLDAHDQRRARVLPFGWLAGLTGLLLLSNLGWFLLWQKTGGEVAELRTAVNKETPIPFTQRDTIFEKIVVYQLDTIYRTVELNREERLALANSAASQKLGNTPFSNQKTTDSSTTEAGQPLRQQAQNTTTGQGNATDTADILGQGLPKISAESMAATVAPGFLPGLPMQLFDVAPHRPILPPSDDQMTPTKQGATAFPLIPQSFTLGIGVGGLTPVAKELASSSGSAVSGSGEIGFSDHLSMVVDASLGRLKFKGYVEDPTLGLPALVPPGDDYELKYFETHDGFKQMLQLGLGMRWHFLPKRRLNPWLGAGWTTQWNPGYELEVEYTHLPTGMEISEDLDVPATAKPLNYLGFNLGMRYRLAEKWHLQAGFNYDFKVGNQLGIERWWNWRAGVAYRF